MSRDVYDEIDFKRLEFTFVYQCAPVIAGLKISNLLIVERSQLKAAVGLIREFGLSAFLLYGTINRLSILVFNGKRLEDYLMKNENLRFLENLGYEEISVNNVLRKISGKYAEYMNQTSTFPDELGIALGYPTEDVLGYMENNGRDYLLNGYWKVYSSAEEKAELFRSFDEITESMMRRLISEQSINGLIDIYKVA